jgi:hypothetical protein
MTLGDTEILNIFECGEPKLKCGYCDANDHNHKTYSPAEIVQAIRTHVHDLNDMIRFRQVISNVPYKSDEFYMDNWLEKQKFLKRSMTTGYINKYIWVKIEYERFQRQLTCSANKITLFFPPEIVQIIIDYMKPLLIKRFNKKLTLLQREITDKSLKISYG